MIASALVLGAWGCGVFQNEPASVAGLFAEALGTPQPVSEKRIYRAMDELTW